MNLTEEEIQAIRQSDEYKAAMNAVKKRDGNRCRICEFEFIEVAKHHILPLRLFPELGCDTTNIVTVPKFVHKESIHGKKQGHVRIYNDEQMRVIKSLRALASYLHGDLKKQRALKMLDGTRKMGVKFFNDVLACFEVRVDLYKQMITDTIWFNGCPCKCVDGRFIPINENGELDLTMEPPKHFYELLHEDAVNEQRVTLKNADIDIDEMFKAYYTLMKEYVEFYEKFITEEMEENESYDFVETYNAYLDKIDIYEDVGFFIFR